MECLTKWLSKSDKSVYPLTWQSLAIATRRSNVTTVAENVQKTMVDPASQLLQHYSSRISQAILSEESVDLLHTEGLISEETMREVKSCGHTLFDGTMKEIYTAVANDHNKLKSFALILFKTKDTANMANELMRHCEDVIFESESAPEDNSDPVISSAIEETRVQMTGIIVINEN
uniref:Death domain-containing protein n=1 Tax=Amphimedon queenslandica TaxID=400682 RepID=A0A1X7U3N4_AMPQE